MSTVESDTTRERITVAAGEIFAERGFDGTTVRDICQKAGANVAAVNYYFGDKQRLYVEAVCQAHRWRMEQFPLPPWSDSTSPETKLADFIGTFVRRVRSGPGGTWHSKLMMREMANPTAACAELVQSSIRPQFEILLQILRELAPADASQADLRLTAFSIVGQCLFYHFADPVIRNLLSANEYESLDIEQLTQHIADFSLTAIKGGSHALRDGVMR
ncbi:MAG TPA: CerR family C-terminal domain-containing protein [Lacipirellulaceae bacterium]|jgi:AcrR family transcriptional regulator|nr:CerR family C-terminal domain-containing protein [Lacipirellulaceae bacterium]